jgi:Mg2+ and Co2+ transporter CorA
MNISFGNFLSSSPWVWALILVLMMVSIIAIFWVFKRRRMF